MHLYNLKMQIKNLHIKKCSDFSLFIKNNQQRRRQDFGSGQHSAKKFNLKIFLIKFEQKFKICSKILNKIYKNL